MSFLCFPISLTPTLPSKPNMSSSLWNLHVSFCEGQELSSGQLPYADLPASPCLQWAIIICSYTCLLTRFGSGPQHSHTVSFQEIAVRAGFLFLSPETLAFHHLVYQNNVHNLFCFFLNSQPQMWPWAVKCTWKLFLRKVTVNFNAVPLPRSVVHVVQYLNITKEAMIYVFP